MFLKIQVQIIAHLQSRALFTCKTVEGVRRLLKEGARVDEKRGDGATPLHVHAENGNCAVVAELLRGKADIDSKDKVCNCYFSTMIMSF